MVSVQNVVAGYTKEVDILNGISLQAHHKEIVTLLGPNGCGKSTLLKTISGYLRPRKGSLHLNGKDVTTLPVHQKIRHCNLGFVPQTENIFTALSVLENLLIGGYYQNKTERMERIEQLSELYPVFKRKLHAPAASLSGGERQILALGRALMPRPQILLLDEPSAGLSPKVLHEVFDAIVQIRDQEDVTILMVEQNAMEAMRISDRAYILSQGTVALTGYTKELLHDPKVRELYMGGRVD
ncbi:ABC transporter ATP-binding protein [Alcaligenes endophyticus]|uniref:ABC transporter ATP-binding protein n=1 Tax=Alcaligenes endophyticus TaxID=1929088 RepID=A0ABT8EGU2_9BURK|nr:ABC transporter ATP-binding protein [Alcaligenes endophyticus]MCX5589972.1 ABC transporter ATP-binding protein [Alcaligenes endophyticus]MDN4120365.1 ABC transporter ATP-binding protein [Alcaligenes endophyticus]